MTNPKNRILNFPFALMFVTVILCTNQIVRSDVHRLTKRTFFSETVKEYPGPEKNYTGIRVSEDSYLLVYYHEQTVAIVEIGRNQELLNCELLEVKTKPDRIVALKLLKPLVEIQTKINFADMKDLMQNCQLLDSPLITEEEFITPVRQAGSAEPRGLISVFKGLFPGTKWCGSGDLASTYFDVGPQIELDKCCRTHDFCPIKVPGRKTQYNITNYAPYTKSHCDCDEIFYQCLKKIGSNLSKLLGNIYFNVAKPECLEDIYESNSLRVIRRQFRKRMKSY